MKRSIFYSAVIAVCLTLAIIGIWSTSLNLHDYSNYSNPPKAKPYSGCLLMRTAELPALLRGEGDSTRVALIRMAAQRIEAENRDMDQLRSYVTWAAAEKKIPITWEP